MLTPIYKKSWKEDLEACQPDLAAVEGHGIAHPVSHHVATAEQPEGSEPVSISL